MASYSSSSSSLNNFASPLFQLHSPPPPPPPPSSSSSSSSSSAKVEPPLVNLTDLPTCITIIQEKMRFFQNEIAKKTDEQSSLQKAHLERQEKDSALIGASKLSVETQEAVCRALSKEIEEINKHNKTLEKENLSLVERFTKAGEALSQQLHKEDVQKVTTESCSIMDLIIKNNETLENNKNAIKELKEKLDSQNAIEQKYRYTLFDLNESSKKTNLVFQNKKDELEKEIKSKTDLINALEDGFNLCKLLHDKKITSISLSDGRSKLGFEESLAPRSVNSERNSLHTDSEAHSRTSRHYFLNRKVLFLCKQRFNSCLLQCRLDQPTFIRKYEEWKAVQKANQTSQHQVIETVKLALDNLLKDKQSKEAALKEIQKDLASLEHQRLVNTSEHAALSKQLLLFISNVIELPNIRVQVTHNFTARMCIAEEEADKKSQSDDLQKKCKELLDNVTAKEYELSGLLEKQKKSLEDYEKEEPSQSKICQNFSLKINQFSQAIRFFESLNQEGHYIYITERM